MVKKGKKALEKKSQRTQSGKMSVNVSCKSKVIELGGEEKYVNQK